MAANRVDELLHDATAALAATSPSPRLDAETLLAHCLGRDRSWFLAWPEATCPETACTWFQNAIERRRAGVPVHYLTGSRGFWSLELQVTDDVLIPRPETELLVELTLDRAPMPERILEPGTGSGAVAIALAREHAGASLIATDHDPAAVRLARRNAASLGATGIDFLVADWLAPFSNERFDVIVANPPYIAPDEPELNQGDVRFEPRAALVAPPDGLAAIRRLAEQAPSLLCSGGWLIVEHGWRQGPSVRDLFAAQGFQFVASHEDLAACERATVGQRP